MTILLAEIPGITMYLQAQTRPYEEPQTRRIYWRKLLLFAIPVDGQASSRITIIMTKAQFTNIMPAMLFGRRWPSLDWIIQDYLENVYSIDDAGRSNVCILRLLML